jgi:NAD(P)-dependent dehydrogenase (short-subunit alcohol dehydrogenase family)
MKTAFILGLTADIGRELAVRFIRDGWSVIGTHRPTTAPAALPPECRLIPCDLTAADSVWSLPARCKGLGLQWDLLIVVAGTEEPIGDFWSCDANEWDTGIQVNALAPLRVVRALYPLRRPGAEPAVAFFSGSGTNNAAPAYSAYCASKIFLIKMCELLDAESPDTNFFIIGPGIVRTKIHGQTLRAPERSGANLKKVIDFLESDNPGTSHDDIHACILWCMQAGKAVMGGRNLSLVHDAWRDGGSALMEQLKANPNNYKLRRFGNDWKLPPHSR